MALQGTEEEDESTEPMSPCPKRPKPFHNFTLPLPKWGTQRNLRYSNAVVIGASTSAGRRFSMSNSNKSTERRQVVEGIAVVGEKLLHELKNDADRIKESIFGEESETLESWNMKMKQKREFKPPMTSASNTKRDFTSPARIDDATGDIFVDHVLLRLRSNIKSNKNERPKFSVQLLRKEIEEDCMVLMGRGPRLRPIKRPRNVQKQLDVGCMLCF